MQAAIQKNELGFANTVSSENTIILQHNRRNENQSHENIH